MIGEHPRTTFMTGSTGFLGHFVLRDLLERGHRMVVLLRAPLAKSRERLLHLLAEIGCDAGPRVESGQLLFVEGALPTDLPEPTWGRTDQILHSAACLELFAANGPTSEPLHTNAGGAAAIVAWAERHGVRTIHAVSTAYTCGWNGGLIPEAFHLPMPSFQTDYERSKWQAEAIFREWSQQPGRSLTILRPSFLVGDSQTGYTTQFGGFYQFARLVGMLKERYRDPNNGRMTHIPLRIPGRPDDVQNVVPVDFVSRVTAEVISHPQFHGRIYHLTNPQPPTNDFMKRCYEDYFDLEGGYFADPAEVLGHCSAAESLLWDKYHLLTPRVVHTPHFDISNTRHVMEQRGIEFPALDRDRVVRLFRWAQDRDWGRSTHTKPAADHAKR